MKGKKGSMENGIKNKKHNNVTIQSSSLDHKQLKIMCEGIDKIPLSQHLQSTNDGKYKKILSDDHKIGEIKKNRKRYLNVKKKKLEENEMEDNRNEIALKKKDSFSQTKSSFLQTTLGNLRKQSLANAMKQKIKLQRPGSIKQRNIHQVGRVHPSPTKQQKISIKKQFVRSPNKKYTTLHTKQKLLDQTLQIEHKQLVHLKNGKSITQQNERYNKKLGQINQEYVFIDGEYLEMENVLIEKIVEKMMGKKENQLRGQNLPILELGNNKKCLQDDCQLDKQGGECRKQQQYQHSEYYQDNQYHGNQEKQKPLTNSPNSRFLLTNIVFIQRWLKKSLRRLTVNKLNTTNHSHQPSQTQPKLSNSHTTHQKQKPSPPSLTNMAKSLPTIKNFIQMKQELLTQEMQVQKNVLKTLLEMKKIDDLTYNNNLTRVEVNFQKQIAGVSQLKNQIQIQGKKIGQLQEILKQQQQIIYHIDKIPVHLILKNFLPKAQPSSSFPKHIDEKYTSNYTRQKSSGCHYQYPTEQDNNNLRTICSQSENGRMEMQGGICQGTLNQILTICSEREAVQVEIEKRHAIQLMGYPQGRNQYSISTSGIAIHSFLITFLRFYEYFYKNQFLKIINLPYGLSQSKRLKKLQYYNGKNEKRTEVDSDDSDNFLQIEAVIGQQILEDFQQHSFELSQNTDDRQRIAIQLQKIHQKAIIDCFNQYLNCFRPYYFINGCPYYWNCSSRALTYYYITQQNIQEVFEKTQCKVLKNSSFLCGTIVESLILQPVIQKQMDLQDKLINYRQAINPILAEVRQEKLGRIEKIEVDENNYRWFDFQEDKTGFLIDVGSLIFQEIIFEMILIQPIGNLVQNSGTEVQNLCEITEKTVLSTGQTTPQKKIIQESDQLDINISKQKQQLEQHQINQKQIDRKKQITVITDEQIQQQYNPINVESRRQQTKK